MYLAYATVAVAWILMAYFLGYSNGYHKGKIVGYKEITKESKSMLDGIYKENENE